MLRKRGMACSKPLFVSNLSYVLAALCGKGGMDRAPRSRSAVFGNRLAMIEGQSSLTRYALALASVGVALGVRYALDPWLGDRMGFVTVYGGVALAVWLGGWRPALVTAVSGFVLVEYFFVPPRHVIQFTTAHFWAGLMAYSLSTSAIIYLGERARRSVWEAGERRKRLEKEMVERARAVDASRQSREQLELISDTLPALISYVDTDVRYQFCNRAYTQWFGISREQILGRTMWDVLGEQAWKAIEPHVKKALAGEVADFETEARYRSGGSRWIHAVYTPHCTSEGKVIGIVVLVSDITARKRSEEAVRESEQRFRSVADAAPVLVWMAGLDKGGLWFNKRWLEFVGRAMEDELGDGWAASVHPDDLDQFIRAYEAAFDERRDFEIEYRLRHHTGKYRWILDRGVPRYTPNGTFEGYIGACADIHEQTEAADAVRRAAERFRSLVSVITDVPWSTNADGAFITPQPAWEKYTGQTWDQYRDLGWANALHPDDRQKVMQAWSAARKTRSLYESQGRFWHAASQQWRYFSGRATPIFDPNGQVGEWVGAYTDVDEQRRTEERLERMVEERTAKLREMVAELEAFSYSIAHDMRAPLRAMQGFSDILLTDYASQLDPAGQNFLQRIASSAGRMDNLIQDTLNYSRVLRAELPMEPVNLRTLVRGIIDTYPTLMPDKADITLEGELPVVLGNEAMLTQVFSNLLGNAVKFVAQGIKPKIRVWAEDVNLPRRSPASPMLKELSQSHKTVRIFVQDNGIGIEPAQHERIFAIFQRASRGYEGTGIGLAIVKKAVERMGGEVSLQSEPGRGSTFWIELKKA